MSDSIGARLRQARELRRLSLQQVSETTKVRAHYLQALENDDLSAIPSAAQARGFLRIYAEFLELDPSGLLPSVEQPVSTPIAETPIAAAPQPERASIWSTLRVRFARQPKKEAGSTSASAEPASESASIGPEQTASLPAVTDAQTTRRSKAASSAVKKNIGR